MTLSLAAWLVFFALVGDPLERLDRVVAVVDEDPILYSEIARATALDPDARDDVERQVLDRLIEQRLRLHEVERHELAPVPRNTIDQQIETITERFGGPEALDRHLTDAGLDRDALRERVARQLRVLAFVEERLSARVFITEEAVVDYYETVFTDSMDERGLELPPLDTVRDTLRRLLEEQALSDEIDAWTEELRERARVVDLLDRPVDLDDLPPVVERLDEPPDDQPPSR